MGCACNIVLLLLLLTLTLLLSLYQVWREGGYSDDLLVAAYCVENGLSIGLPASGLYPQLLPPTTTFKQLVGCGCRYILGIFEMFVCFMSRVHELSVRTQALIIWAACLWARLLPFSCRGRQKRMDLTGGTHANKLQVLALKGVFRYTLNL
jgi:hypothetical protein